MRSGTTQQSPTYPAKVTVTVDGDTYTDSDLLMRVHEDEQVWGGQFIVELDNSDGTLDNKDYEGKAITFNHGFQSNGAGSDLANLWVYSQGFTSREGKLLLSLNCVDMWIFLAAVDASVGAEYWNNPEQAPGEPHEDATHYDKTILEIITSIISDAVSCSIDLDDNDGIINTQKPPMRITNARTGVRQLMEMTESYLLWKADGRFHVVQPDAHGTTYSYNTLNLFFSNIHDEAVTVPNRVIFYGTDEDDKVRSGNDVDETSYSRLGIYIDRHFYHTRNTITLITGTQEEVEAACTALAEGHLAKIQGERSQGMLVAPMHCAQELFDKVSVTDSRYDTPKTTTGYVHRIIREYDRGVYRITLQLGGVATGFTPPEGVPSLPLATPDAGSPPPFSFQFDFLPAYLPVTIDLEFTATDDDDVSWTGGNIQCADGTVFSVDAGSLNLANSDPYFLYYTLNDSSLNNTQTFNEACSAERILIAFLKKAPETNQKAMIIPAKGGKTPTWNQEVISANCITANEIYVQYLAAITANMGLLEAGEIRLGTGDLNATSGTATGGSTITLEDSGQSWDVDGLINKTIRIVQSGVTYERTITDNDATSVTFTPALGVGVTTETYYLGGGAYTGWRLWEEDNLGRMAGFNAGEMQFYVGSDGRLYAANGMVILDYDGITISWPAGDSTSTRLQFKYDGTRLGYITATDSGGFMVRNDNNADLVLLGYGTADIVVGTNEVSRAIRPENTNYTNLGTIDKQWKGGYFSSRLKIPVGTDLYD